MAPIDDRSLIKHPRRARRGPAGTAGHPTCPSTDDPTVRRRTAIASFECPVAEDNVNAAPRDSSARRGLAATRSSDTLGNRALPWSHRLPEDAAGSTNLSADATANAESIAKRERCSVRKVNMTISLAFLAPDLVKAAIEGRLPHGMGSGPPRRHARRMVRAAPDAWPSFAVGVTFEPSCRGNAKQAGPAASHARSLI